MIIRPQPGPQEAFLSTGADIAIYGGAAGGGKSYALLLEPLRHIQNPNFGAVIFRRESTQITLEGGLWDTAETIYPNLGAKGVTNPNHIWAFPSGATVAFRHLQHDKHVYSYQSAQIPLIGFDELTHFSEKQFWYMLSRSRTTCGVRPYIRATTNPDADSWVAKLIDWWIGEDGYPIKERSGDMRYFVRMDNELIFADRREDLPNNGEDSKSLTFIAARLEDNKILMEKDPGYLANLKALTRVERERLLGGNWKIKETAGTVFDRAKIQIVDFAPPGLKRLCRAWDIAATANGGDWTVGVKIGAGADGFFYVADVVRGQWSPGQVDGVIESVASQDGRGVTIRHPIDPGQAGKAQAEARAKKLAGYTAKFKPVTGSKLTRAQPFASAVENGLVRLVRGPWNEAFLNELHSFTGEPKNIDDQVDAASDAFDESTKKRGGFFDLA